jgi:hypothetical protein
MSAILKRELKHSEVIHGDTYYANRRYRTIIEGDMIYINGVCMPLIEFNKYFTFEHEMILSVIKRLLVKNDKFVTKTEFKSILDTYTYGRGASKRFSSFVMADRDSIIQIRHSSATRTKVEALKISYQFLYEIYNADYSSVNALEQVRWGNCGIPLKFSELRLI